MQIRYWVWCGWWLATMVHSENVLKDGVRLTRHRRYLLYPDGDPARVQLIIGVGLPVDLEDEAVTMGYVIKMLFHMPMNSTDYTQRWYDAAPSAARSHRTHRSSQGKAENDTRLEEVKKSESNGAYVYTEGGKMEIASNGLVDEDLDEPPSFSRWDIYRMLQHMMETNGLSGRACILRTICEAAETPFTFRNGLLGELAHIIFTPSTSRDRLLEHSDNEYHAAERLGSDQGSDCGDLFSECETSFLEMFSEVGIPSLMGLG